MAGLVQSHAEALLVLVAVLSAGILVAGRVESSARDAPGSPAWRLGAVAGATLAVLVAAEPPLTGYAGRLLSAHVAQDALLFAVAAPLLALAAPWGVAGDRRPAGRWRPVAAGAAFSLALVGWHVPAAYDWAARHPAADALEAASYLGLGTLFWAQVAAPGGRRPPLERFPAVGFVVAGAFVCWVIGFVLAVTTSAIYPHFAAAARAHGANPLVDQELAGGILWIPAEIPYIAAVFLLIHAWLARDERDLAGRGLDGGDGGLPVAPAGADGRGPARGVAWVPARRRPQGRIRA